MIGELSFLWAVSEYMQWVMQDDLSLLRVDSVYICNGLCKTIYHFYVWPVHMYNWSLSEVSLLVNIEWVKHDDLSLLAVIGVYMQSVMEGELSLLYVVSAYMQWIMQDNLAFQCGSCSGLCKII